MNVIDTFYFLFRTDSKEAQSDVKKLDEQIAALAKKGNQRSVEEDKQLKNLRKTRTSTIQDLHDQNKVLGEQKKSVDDLSLSFSKLALSGVTALEGVFALQKLKEGIINTVNYNAAIEKTAKLTTTNARELSILNNVVARAGGNPGGTEYLDFITKLNEQYAGLGINQRIANVNNELGGLADKIKDLNDVAPGSGYAFAKKLGLGDDLYLALKGGRRAFEESVALMTKLDNTTDDTAASSYRLKQQWQDIGVTFTSAFNDILPLAKFLSVVVEGFSFGLRGVVATLKSIGSLSLKPLDDLRQTQNAAISRINGAGSNSPKGGVTVPVIGPNSPLGIRSNNPGNLQPGGREAVFGSLQKGLSAEQSQLGKYGARGVSTLRGIAASWPDRAGAAGWLQNVARYSGIGPDDPINLADPSTQARVANAINAAENGAAYGNLITGAQNGISAANQTSVPSSSNSTRTVTIGSITINSQATDAKGIASDLHGELAKTVGSFDDGVNR